MRPKPYKVNKGKLRLKNKKDSHCNNAGKGCHKNLIALLVLFSFLVVIPNIIAVETLGYFKQGDCITLIQVASNSTSCNITTVYSPNATIVNNKLIMTRSNTDFSNLTCNSSKQIGRYIVNGVCNLNGQNTVFSYDYYVVNGNINASGGVIIFFAILFLLLVFFTCYLAVYTLGHLLTLDFDVLDLAIDWGLFFGIVTMYFLETNYLGNAGIEKYLLWFIAGAGIFMFVIPIIALIMSYTIGSLNKRKMNVRVPKRRLMLR